MIELTESKLFGTAIKKRRFLGKRLSMFMRTSRRNKFTWFSGEPEGYQTLFSGKKLPGRKVTDALLES